jgi:hypothetical protein
MSFKTISIIGSGYSGSSAVYEYLKLANIFYDPFPNKEFSLCYDPGGIMDLEYVIKNKSSIDNHIFFYKQFKKNIDFYVSKKKSIKPGKNFQLDNPYFRKILKNYLNNLIDTRYKGQTLFMNFEKNKFKNFLNKLFLYVSKKKNDDIILFKNLIDFNKITKNLFYEILYKNNSKKKNIILDQGGLYSNPISSTKYYKDPMCIIVERDPRDIYVEYKFKSAFSYPKENVEKFCEFFINQKKTLNLDEHKSNKILKINFEDFVIENSKSVLKIAKFLKINPDLLLNNTKFDLNKSKANVYKYKSLISNSESKIIKTKLIEYFF